MDLLRAREAWARNMQDMSDPSLRASFDLLYPPEAIQAAVCVCMNVQEILAVSRKNNHQDFGLPGGKVEAGEHPADAAAREFYEETGFKAKVLFPVFELEGCICYFVESSTIDYSKKSWVNNEGAVVAWVNPSVLVGSNASFREYNSSLFKEIHNMVRSENG